MGYDIKRRTFLKGTGTAGVAGLAGCLGDSGESNDGDGGDGGDGGGTTTTEAEAGGPDTLLVIGYPASGVQLFKDYYREFDTDVRILVPDGMREKALPEKVGNDLPNVRGTAPTAAGPGAEFFGSLYEEEYGSAPGIYTAQTYDSTACLLLANVLAGANDGVAVRDNVRAVANPDGEEFGPENLAEAVEAAAAGQNVNYVGASSAVDFDGNGDAAAAVYEVFGFGEQGLHREEFLPFQSESDLPTPAPSGDGSDAGRTVKVGVLQPETGDLGSVGKPIMNAGLLPATQLDGADTGFTFDARGADTQTDAAAGAEAAQSLVDAGYPAVCGAAASSTTLRAAKEVFVPNQVVSCSPASTAPSITDLADDDFVFRTPPTDALQGQVLAEYAYDTGSKSIAVLYVDNDYGLALADVFARRYEELGGELVAEVPFGKEQSSYTLELEEALQAS